jgi:hypothetical protein
MIEDPRRLEIDLNVSDDLSPLEMEELTAADLTAAVPRRPTVLAAPVV